MRTYARLYIETYLKEIETTEAMNKFDSRFRPVAEVFIKQILQ
jgi:hypothetical protein